MYRLHEKDSIRRDTTRKVSCPGFAFTFICVLVLLKGETQAFAEAPATLFPAPSSVPLLVSGSPGQAELRRRCDTERTQKAAPIRDFSPPPHYAALEIEKRYSDALDRDGETAYDLSLCYLVSHNQDDAAAGEAVLEAWAQGVVTIGSDQGAADFNFSFYRFLLAAYVFQRDAGWQSPAFRNFVIREALYRLRFSGGLSD